MIIRTTTESDLDRVLSALTTQSVNTTTPERYEGLLRLGTYRPEQAEGPNPPRHSGAAGRSAAPLPVRSRLRYPVCRAVGLGRAPRGRRGPVLRPAWVAGASGPATPARGKR